MRKRIIFLLVPLVLLAGLYGGWNWWRDWRYRQSTDDAYIQSDISLISPKIEGYIKDVRVAGQRARQCRADPVRYRRQRLCRQGGAGRRRGGHRRGDGGDLWHPPRLPGGDDRSGGGGGRTRPRPNLPAPTSIRNATSRSSTSDVASRQRFETAEADARKAAAALLRAKAALEAEKQQLAVSRHKNAKRRRGSCKRGRRCSSPRTTSIIR